MWLPVLAIGVQVLVLGLVAATDVGSPGEGTAIHLPPSSVPDVTILYNCQRFPGQGELSCVTGNPDLTLLTHLVPGNASNLNFTDDGQKKTASWQPYGIEARGVVCKAGHTDDYNTSIPLLPSDASFIPAQLSFTINKAENLTVEFHLAKGVHVLWQKNPTTEGEWKEGQVNGHQLVIPYHQLSGSGLYSVTPYSQTPDNERTTGTFSVLVRECPAERYGPDCDLWCPDCLHGGVCHEVTGQCVCPPGLTGSHCHTSCPAFHIGRDCSVELRHPRGYAVCLPHPLGCHCAPGYGGFRCDQDLANTPDLHETESKAHGSTTLEKKGGGERKRRGTKNDLAMGKLYRVGGHQPHPHPHPHHALPLHPTPRRTRSLSAKPGQPVINHKIIGTWVVFSWDKTPGASHDNLYIYKFKYKTTYKACQANPGSSLSRWSSSSSWSPWSQSTIIQVQKVPYSTITMKVKAKNDVGEGEPAEIPVDVDPEVPGKAFTSLSCHGQYPTSCSVQVDCQKQNGPNLTVSYQVKERTHRRSRTHSLPATALDIQDRANFPLPKDLLPYTRYTLTAFPANDVGSNTRAEVEAEFKTPPAKPGRVTSMRKQLSSETITVTWGRPRDNPPRGQLADFKILWRKRGNETWEERILYPTASSYTITGLTHNQQYEVRVMARNRDVNTYGPYSRVLATTPEGKPSPVTDPQEKYANQTSLAIIWGEPADPAGTIKSYKVTLNKVEEQGGTKVEQLITSKDISGNSAQITGLEEGQQYRVSVAACNSKACSDRSFLTLWTLTNPYKPVVSKEVKESSVVFSFNTPTNTNSQQLQFSFQTKTTFKACGSSEHSQWSPWSGWNSNQSVEVEKPSPYSTMAVRVKAKNSVGEGEAATSSVQVPPAVPDVEVIALNCPEPCPTFCSVAMETNCSKENGQVFSISVDIALENRPPRSLITTLTLTKGSGAYTKVNFPLPKDLISFQEYKILVYPANSVGRNTNPSLMKEDIFTFHPADSASCPKSWVEGKMYAIAFAIVILTLIIAFLVLVCCSIKKSQQTRPARQERHVRTSSLSRLRRFPQNVRRANQCRTSPQYLDVSEINLPPASVTTVPRIVVEGCASPTDGVYYDINAVLAEQRKSFHIYEEIDDTTSAPQWDTSHHIYENLPRPAESSKDKPAPTNQETNIVDHQASPTDEPNPTDPASPTDHTASSTIYIDHTASSTLYINHPQKT